MTDKPICAIPTNINFETIRKYGKRVAREHKEYITELRRKLFYECVLNFFKGKALPVEITDLLQNKHSTYISFSCLINLNDMS